MTAALQFIICNVPIFIASSSAQLLTLFESYFRYYRPQRINDLAMTLGRAGAPLLLELEFTDELPPRETLVPPQAELFSQTGVLKLWRTQAADDAQERLDFESAMTHFQLVPASGRATGLLAPAAWDYPHILANTYTLFVLLLLLRRRGWYHLHAAAVLAPDGKLVLLPGSQRAGKTTTTTALGLAGWKPLADDSLLVGWQAGQACLTALRKYFHLGDQLFELWPQLREAAVHHRYLGRSCVAGLEFFDAVELAEQSFHQVDYVVLPQISGATQSRLEALSLGEALLKLAEQSMFFQLWREHTELQFDALTQLFKPARCYHLLAGSDILANPRNAAAALAQIVERM